LGPGLRLAGATRLTGIEVVTEEAELARAHYDDVVAASVEQALEQLDGPFDTILCLDVLEHLVDPERVMSQLHAVAAPEARLQVSLPNARHVSLMKDLIVKGTFGYTESSRWSAPAGTSGGSRIRSSTSRAGWTG
jgi:2-polyprenyl-3-methyl-5-hydroxy-6-metoxy-1,4-benzoquinol methylase